MIKIIIGILIGIFTSFFTGLVLIWKGERIIQNLQKLPSKRRIDLLSRAYIQALQNYPYNTANIIFMSIVFIFFLSHFIACIIITCAAFYNYLFNTNKEVITEIANNISLVIHHPIIPWVLLLITVWFAYLIKTIYFDVLPVEMLISYTFRDITRLRECVFKCATKDQYLEYIYLESNASNTQDLKELIAYAKGIIDSPDLELADKIMKRISEIPLENQEN